VKPLFFALLATFVGFLLYAAAWLGANQGSFSMPVFALEITLVSVVVTASIYMVLARTVNPRLFVNIYLLTIVMKLIFYSAMLLIIRFIALKSLMPNAVFLLVAYLVFTTLEVAVLFRKVNR
jgi:hypothetical protein